MIPDILQSIDLKEIKRVFIVVGNKAVTSPFNLNDMPGKAGRMDILCRCIAQAMFTSHNIRRDTAILLLLKGEPNPPKAILIKGSEVKYMAPDERNIGGLIRKALGLNVNEKWKKSTPGIYIAKKDLQEILEEITNQNFDIYYLREDGIDIKNVKNSVTSKIGFILGDHSGLNEKDEKIVLKFAKGIIKVSPLSLHSDQCIVIVHYELDTSLIKFNTSTKN